MIVSNYDRDVDPGPIDETYAPSEDLLATIDGIAEAGDLAFRFWAGMTLFVNLSSVFPWSDAEDVITFVINDALGGGEPTDGHYQLVTDENDQISGVVYEDCEPASPDEDHHLVFDIVSHPDTEVRRAALMKLATLVALTEENEAVGGGFDEAFRSVGALIAAATA